MGRTVIKIAGLLLGLLLFITGIAKAIAFGEFAAGIVREVPIPPRFGTLCAVAIVATETSSGAGLYFRRTRRLSGVVATLLFLLFSILIAGKIVNGADLQCDCFGVLAVRLPLLHHLLLDLTLGVIALLVAGQPHGSPVGYCPPRRVPIAFLVPLLLGLLFLIWGLFSAFRSPSVAAAPPEKMAELDIAFPVKAGRAMRGTLVKGISSSGLLRPARKVELISKVGGEIVSVHGYEGKKVAKGEIVAMIDRTEFRLAYDRAASALLAAQIEYRTLSASPFLQTLDSIQARRDLEAARGTYQRARTAYAAGRIDGPALIRAQREYEATRAYFSANREDVVANRSGLVQARETWERARRELDATEVRAPFAGRIAGWEGAVGMHARAGQVLCVLVDLSRILIDADIIEAEADRIRLGEAAAVTCIAYPGTRFGGRVCAVSPVVDLKTRMLRATLEVSKRGAGANSPSAILRPGMFASVLIETDRLRDRLLVPREALLMRDLRPLVFTLEKGLAKWRYVETGEENQELVEIRSGISAGDTVIVDGHQTLAHDARVYIKE